MSYFFVSGITGQDLPNIESKGKIDPYASFEYQGIKKKTDVVKEDLNPVWNEKLEWNLEGRPLSPDDTLTVQVKDWERIGRNRLLGTATVSLRDLVKHSSHQMQVDIALLDGNSRMTPAKIALRMEYVPPKGAPSGGDGDEGGGEGVDEEEDEELGTEEVEGGGAIGAVVEGKKKRRRKPKRSKLSDKPQDFQVRIKVIEGRQLSGSNISPVVRVTVSNQVKQTRVKFSTNKPFYDETFFFNFNMSPAELFDEVICFEIFNSKRLRANSMIGYFKCDVGMVYEESDHAFIRKWILLTDPDDKMAGVKDGEPKGKSRGAAGSTSFGGGEPVGYLKATMIVLGPGDETPQAAMTTGQDDNDDIEKNLLRPAGVMLRPATFSLKVYRAEDIPQMDPGFFEGVKKVLHVGEEQKELVDPYLVFSFAGKRAKTRTHYNSDHPEFNQELHLPFKFPSMCERLKLQLFDWDRLTADDVIGSNFIPISALSGQGEDGFLPCFGPCFVNFYGSTREYSDLPDEFDELNTGLGEGVAYRGRVLVELETKLSDCPAEKEEDLTSAEIIRVQPYLRRRKFKLYACFLEAFMISTIDGPVEFEVSIGNYGNKLDKTVAPSASTTPPTNAIFDGCHYYFLPWGDTKPCVVVESHWEDIAFRLENFNILTRMCERLESNIEKVKLSVEAKDSTAETAAHLISCLDQLIKDCKKPLPKFDGNTHGVTDLDLKIQDIRVMEKLAIMEEASKLRENATDIEEALIEIESYLCRLNEVTVEPQNSMPDVVIWMLSGSKRIAYHRIPASDVLYAKNSESRGLHCGNIQNIYLRYPGKKAYNIEDYPEVPAQMRMILWLGLDKDQADWTNRENVEGDFCVYAETYENNMNVLGAWTSKGLPRPSWSNPRGDVKLPRDSFKTPEGWKFEGEWFVNPELSLTFDRDTGHTTFLEDVFENQSRIPGCSWGLSSTPWTDVRGDSATGKDDLVCPEGWEWVCEWAVDLNRAVDEDGFEYTVESTMGGYGPVEKTYHLCRRRRWVRTRKVFCDSQTEDKKGSDQIDSEGWEYASVFGMKFHNKERKMDLVRRRRWHRKMIQDDPNAPAIFTMDVGEGKDAAQQNVPRMFITFDNPHKYQLRAYIYQARDLLSSDPNGLSDPYCRVAFANCSQVTETIQRTLCPTWDQTLIFDNVLIYGSAIQTSTNPPVINMELYDKDPVGKDEYLGRCVAQPLVRLRGVEPPNAKLLWQEIKQGDQYGGEILVAFELFLDEGNDLPFSPPMRNNLFLVPNGIRPVMQRTAVEVLCWGVRNMKRYQLANVSSPCIEFECGGNVIESSVIKNTQRCPNFDKPLFFFDVFLPKEEMYTPPMNIKVKDNRSFGRRPVVGIHTLKSLQPYRCNPVSFDDEVDEGVHPPPPPTSTVLEIREDKKKRKEMIDENVDWWSKYYSSVGELDKAGDYLQKGYDTITVYPCELERVDENDGFQDFIKTFSIYRGKVKSREEQEDAAVGEFKGLFKVYPLPSDPNAPLPPRILRNLPSSNPVECTVRVYIIKVIDLQPQDSNGLADPYIVVTLGKHKKVERDGYVANTLNPTFGRMFEMTATLPIVKDLNVQIMDYDLISRDDSIGETVIDLENRFLTRCRATCGLPQTYCISGPNQWRDIQTPRQILDQWCEQKSMAKPQYLGNTQVVLESKVYKLQDFEEGMIAHSHIGPAEERLALHVLSCQTLIPEHVETRPLFNSLQPGVEQGRVQMWVDIFPKELGNPGPAFDITPRKASNYELRVIIWNTSDVVLDETSITGEQMSDIYVKTWIQGMEDDKQKTDVHFRSLDGEGNFNWRMLFPFGYLPAEKTMVVRKKEHFWSLDETEEKLPPQLIVQVWDNDQFSPDDFLGTLELNLNEMPKPTKKSAKCGLHQLPNVEVEVGIISREVEIVSLFEQKRVYGWWPVLNEEGGQLELTGKVEMSLEILREEDAQSRPTGLGREEPNQNPFLEEPNRPATSFRWFTSPFKTLRYIIWRNYKWYIIIGLILLLIIAAVVVFLYAMPGYTVKKMFQV